ncbi:MAG: iron complex outermembrane receptor protein, partial [Halioglobus sp.]
LNTFENADEASAWGVELEIMALLGEHITASGSYSYNHTEYDDFFSKDANACALGPRGCAACGRVLWVCV